MSFSTQLKGATRRISEDMDKTRRAVVIKLFSAVIKDTPVAIGLLRGNWQTTIGNPATQVIGRIDKTGALSIADAEKKTNASKPGQTVWLSNNLPYAYRIEYEGHSHTKAPEGMVRKNVARISRIVA